VPVHRLIIIGGKGGVGRTTVAVALGLALARRGHRTLVAHVRARPPLAELYGCERIDEEIRAVGPDLWAVNMDPQASIREMGLLVLRFRALYHLVLENRLVRSFLRAVPALEEYSMVGKAWYHTTEQRSDGRARFQTVIFDGPATGHLVSMLRIPQVILDAVPEGPLTGDARRARELLADPERTAMWLVTLAEEMAVSEAVDLHRAARDELQLRVDRLLVNALYPADLTQSAALDQVLRQATPSAESGLDLALRATRLLRERRAINDHYLKELAQRLPLRRTELPMLFAPRFDRAALEPLVTLLGAALEAPQAPAPAVPA
jgi:anion-transporting  ArsA/GET3 family ATPase